MPPSYSMSIPDPEGVTAALREAVQNQIAANDPAETKGTFNRLIAGGFAEEDVWRLLSAVLAVELATILRESRPFSLDAYVKALKALPDLPLDE
jgi:hypothetical protein